MPTTLKSYHFDGFDVSYVKGLDVQSAYDWLRSEAEPKVNNSWVGYSKFLHMLRPDLFPIWDSHIARALGLKMYSTNRSGIYANYFYWVHFFALPKYGTELARLEKGILENTTEIRRLEFAIFSAYQNI
nr:DUF6308 family protein [Maritimibacter dapengensis]